ncbi:MAG TPA: fibronectin type III-like domain-contianing protein, partial [Ferruginibacter sp.]|nr:fibronectin type III-like domain-contianing protein [Ferruginibacter sp.]
LLHSPRYPFGYGLSYASFVYSDLKLNKDLLRAGKDSIDLAVTIHNSSERDGTETVQLYLRDMAASVARPVKELIGFQQVFLKKGETKTIHFTVSEKNCRFYNQQLNYVSEPGVFKLMVGGNSCDVLETSFELKK